MEFVQFFGLQLHHLTPNGILYLSTFVHLCEVYIGIPLNFLLFRYFFHLRMADASSPLPFGCVSVQLRQGLSGGYFQFTLFEKMVWANKWFYVPKPSPYFTFDLSITPLDNPFFSKKLYSSEVAALRPLLNRIHLVKELGLTGHGLVAGFLRRLVQPLMQRGHLGFEYSGVDDSSRIKLGVVPTEEQLFVRMKSILYIVPCVPPPVKGYDAENPPPAVSFILVTYFVFCRLLFLVGFFL